MLQKSTLRNGCSLDAPYHIGLYSGANLIMPAFRKNRISLRLARHEGILDDEEFVLLYDLPTSNNPDLPYWKYKRFDLDVLTCEECKSECRFYRSDIYALCAVLEIPNEINCYNGLKVDASEALCILLIALPIHADVQILSLGMQDQYLLYL